MNPKEDLLRKSLEKIAGKSQKLGKNDLKDLKDSLIDYYKTLLEVASPGMNVKIIRLSLLISIKSSYFQKAKPTTNNENDEINEEFYVSGCQLNYHLLSVSKSPQEIQKNSKDALDLVSRYGHKLEPHPLYKLYKVKPTRSELDKSTMIKSNKLTDGKSSKIIKIIDKVVQNSGAELVLTDEETSKEFDCLHILATGGLCNQLVMVSFSDMDEKDFKEMTTSAKYAKQVYIRVRKTLVLSNRFQMNKESDIKVLAFECEQKLTAVISAANLFPNDPSVFKSVKGCKITTCPAIDHLSLNPNQFDSRYDFEWGLSWAPEFEGRGGLDYYFPIGWKGYALKVLGKYDDGRDDWIVKHNASGWAVGYHGVSYDPVKKIQSILNSKLRPGLGQVYQSSQDCNPLLSGPQKGRVVGKGIYLSQKIDVPERSYSTPLEVDGKKYIVLFQCRIKPREIRMPKEVPTYYVVPDGDYIRPYRILVKEVTNKH